MPRSTRFLASIALHAALLGLGLGCTGSEPADAPPAEGSEATPEASAVPEPAPAAEVPPTPPPRPAPPEPVVADAAEVPPVAAPGGLVLAPRFSVGDEIRRRVTLTRTSDVRVQTGGRDAEARIDAELDTTFAMKVTEVDKGAPVAVEVTFEAFERRASGAPTRAENDPHVGAIWSCRTNVEPILCATDEVETRTAPAWLSVSFGALLPSRPVEPAESWSRRVGVAPLLGFGEQGVARAVLRAEPPYETGDGFFSTVTFEFDADDAVSAFGRTMQLRATGTGALEFDLRRMRVASFDARWTGSARAQRRSGDQNLESSRETQLVLRMTELASAQ